jgi:hypothetical protein
MENEEESKSLMPPAEATPLAESPSIWSRIKSFFSSLKDYRTSKDVRILDRRLGYIYYGTLAMIILYLVIVVFIINQAYLDREKAEGIVLTTLLGTAYSTGAKPYVWDVAEENPWGQETSAVFVPSKVVVTRGQYQGLCVDPLLYCERDDDCSSSDLPNVVEASQCVSTAEGSKGCLAWRWCPAENSQTSDVYYLENAAHQTIWLQYRIEFERLADKSKDNFDDVELDRFPGQDSNAWEVSDIVLMAGSNFSDITEKGALFKATLVINCIKNPSEECDTHLEVKRLDDLDSGGYSMSHAEYYRVGDVLYRDLYHMKGARIMFSCIGIYIATSLSNIVLQIASALGLIIASRAITDGVMLNVLKEKFHFKSLKVKESDDFNKE